MRNILSALLMGFVLLTAGTAFANAPAKTWTFLVYINGNNNLDSFGKANIIDMEKVGSNDQVNVVVEWASMSRHKTVRMLIKKNTTGKGSVTSPVVQDLGKVDMGDYRTLEDFIQWGVKNYPAEHYFVTVWNHGSGWHKLKKSAMAHFSKPDISWDDNTDNSIKTEELGLVMADAAKIIGHKVDIYASDACLMAMGEVAAEMSDSVHYFAGSEETEPGSGWPYAKLLSHWEATPNASPADVAKILTEEYLKSYQGGSNGTQDVTFSAFDLSKLPALHEALAAFGTNLRQLTPIERSGVSRASSDTVRFTYSDYADLLDFIKNLSKAEIKGIDTQLLANVKTAASDLIIANGVTSGYADATGLTIWIPQNSWSYKEHSERYKGMKFNVATQWGETMASLLQGKDETAGSEEQPAGEETAEFVR
jgi:hypothetical protein